MQRNSTERAIKSQSTTKVLRHFPLELQESCLGIWVVTDDIGVGKNTQRKLVELLKKKKANPKKQKTQSLEILETLIFRSHMMKK